jgi:hypothetical protein
MRASVTLAYNESRFVFVLGQDGAVSCAPETSLNPFGGAASAVRRPVCSWVASVAVKDSEVALRLLPRIAVKILLSFGLTGFCLRVNGVLDFVHRPEF